MDCAFQVISHCQVLLQLSRACDCAVTRRRGRRWAGVGWGAHWDDAQPFSAVTEVLGCTSCHCAVWGHGIKSTLTF